MQGKGRRAKEVCVVVAALLAGSVSPVIGLVGRYCPSESCIAAAPQIAEVRSGGPAVAVRAAISGRSPVPARRFVKVLAVPVKIRLAGRGLIEVVSV